MLSRAPGDAATLQSVPLRRKRADSDMEGGTGATSVSTANREEPSITPTTHLPLRAAAVTSRSSR